MFWKQLLLNQLLYFQFTSFLHICTQLQKWQVIRRWYTAVQVNWAQVAVTFLNHSYHKGEESNKMPMNSLNTIPSTVCSFNTVKCNSCGWDNKSKPAWINFHSNRISHAEWKALKVICYECAGGLITLYTLHYSHIHASLVPRPEEEEKGPGFSHSRMLLIAVEFHRLRILLIYFCTLVTRESILNITLSVDLW